MSISTSFEALRAKLRIGRTWSVRSAVWGCIVLGLALYFLFRDPTWRAVDFARGIHYWRLFWITIAITPERFEPLLERTGIILRQPVPVRLRWDVVMLLDPLDLVDSQLLFAHSWEAIEWQWVQDHLREGDTFVDVGAHHGTYSLRAAATVGPKGKVIAIEPNPETLVRLRKNLSLNSFTNISVDEVACGDRASTMQLFSSSRRNTGMASLSKENAKLSGDDGGVTAHEVKVIPLDDLPSVSTSGRIAVIKIDTEGAETMVIRGARRTIQKMHPAIVVESIPRQLENLGSSLTELEDLLRSLNYERKAFTGFNALWTWSK